MFIVWGTKVVKSYRGRRADYCPLCRAVQPMRRIRVETVGHLYYIPLGTRTPHSLTDVCEDCGIIHAVPWEDDAGDLVRSRRADLDTLVEATNPNVYRRFEQTLSLPDRLRSRQAKPDERITAVRTTFQLADILLAYRTCEIHFDRFSALGLFAAIVVPIGILASGSGRASSEQLEMIALVAVVILGLLTVFLFATDARRYARRHLMPRIVRALAPLDPSAEELDEVLLELRESKTRLARYLSGSRIREAIDQLPVEHF